MLGAALSESRGPWEPPSPEELQSDFPQYEIRGILGRGGMGAVYQGWQKSLDRLVAIKILPPGLDDSVGGFTERFKREAKAMAQLQHPGIVTVFDAGTTPGGLLYFVMECITGTDVQQLLRQHGRLDPAEALRITGAVCDALAYAHEHGIIHRDIKPSNIMLDARGNVKVADFGLAKTTTTDTTMLTVTNVSMGTPEFMAPESLKGVATVDHRADLYAVGVMLYQMLTGKIPRGRFELPSGVVKGVDRRFDAIVDKAMQTDRDRRYSTAMEMKAEVESVLVGKKRGAGPSSTGGTSSKAQAARNGRTALLIATAVGVLGGGAYFVTRPAAPQDDAPAPVKSAVSPSSPSDAPSRAWTKVITKPEDIPESARKEGLRMGSDGWIDGTSTGKNPVFYIPGTVGRNQGIRLRGKVAPSVKSSFGFNVSVRLKAGGQDGWRDYLLSISSMDRRPSVHFQRRGEGGAEFSWVRPDTPLKPGVEFDMELVVIEDKLYAKFNGKPLPVATDTLITEGQLAFQTTHFVRDVEVINLDGLSEAEALKAAGISSSRTLPSQSAAKWIAVDFTTASSNPNARLEGEQLHVSGGSWLPLESRRFRQVAHRITFVWRDTTKNVKLISGEGSSAVHYGKLGASRSGGQYWEIGHYPGRDVRLDGSHPDLKPPLKPGDTVVFQFATMGNQHFVWLNGKLLGSATHPAAPEGGGLAVHAIELLLDRYEYMNLDGLPEAEALKAAAIEKTE
jgi:serine/threonine protein kinase